MGIDEAPFPLLDHMCALCGEIKGGHRQDKAPSLEGFGRPNLGRFQLKAVGFIGQKVLFNIKP